MRFLYRSGKFLVLAAAPVLELALVAVLGLGIWSGSEGSLATALRLASRMLPADDVLQVEGVTGSLREGGTLRSLRWQQPGLLVEARSIAVNWEWRRLLEGQWKVPLLRAQWLRVEPSGAAAPASLQALVLPLHMDAQLELEALEWAGTPPLQATKLSGHYRYDGTLHRLEGGAVAIGSGTYRIDASLQALAPMAVSAQLSGAVRATVPGRSASLALQADGTLQGTLSGPQASLDLSADLRPAPATTKPVAGAPEAHLQARLHPGSAQEVQEARAQWQALDLAALWPQAPQTDLSGRATVVPDGAGWQADLQLHNRLVGPLDRQRLPLQNLSASLLFREGQWRLSSADATDGTARLQATGTFAAGTAAWSAQAVLQGMVPGRIDSRWPGTALDGTVTLSQTPLGLAFEGRLTPAAAPLRSAPADASARWDLVSATGLWKGTTLALGQLQVRTPQAQASGALTVDTASYATSGDVRAHLPGAQLHLVGDWSATAGQGNATAQVADAEKLMAWMRQWPIPGLPAALAGASGQLGLDLRWQGGWQRQGRDLQLEGQVSANALKLKPMAAAGTAPDPGPAAWQLDDARMDLAGTLQDLALTLRGRGRVGDQPATLEAASHLAALDAGHWQARLDQLQATVGKGPAPGGWSASLARPLMLDWQQSSDTQSVHIGGGQVSVSGPAPGVAGLQWESAVWTQARRASPLGSTAPAAQWQSRGSLQGIPLAWLEWLGQTQVANLGLRGDLVFGGAWDLSVGEHLRLRASLTRSSGDLQMLSDDSTRSLVRAGLREARLAMEVDDESMRLGLVWNSEAAGNARADLSSRLRRDRSGWTWASDAPLDGTIQASLPRVGAWSLLAPPGWRIQGTLSAQAVLAGTRGAPLWRGSAEARDLAVRAVAEGIDFSQGVLRLQFKEEHMEVLEFSLQGAGGPTGGRLTGTGTVDWLPAAGVPGSAAQLQMRLEATAEALRLSTRADQRVAVSGRLTAELARARLVVRGGLRVDQALLILPEDTAPVLGDDVIVRRSNGRQRNDANTPETARRGMAIVPDVLVTLDLGTNFMLEGQGLKTRLAGLLTLHSEGREATPRLTGELRTVSGTYRAYGQYLNIERGALRFTGAYDNPVLDILALRPNLSQTVGVQIGGTAQLPVVRLYADPDLPDGEKLSWLVLGRSSAGGGTEAAMLQQAAVALLSGKRKGPTDGLLTALGLDEVSLGETATTRSDGTAGAATATVKLGKRLSRDFYVAYERSLAGTLGTFYVFYDLSRRFTLRAQSGQQNAVDLIFTTRFD